ncbi:MAG: hypothetical protein QOE80_336 [Actinomycetota bacterium]|nr:hypothetical protein [Actinomycetota bacterium]
MSLTVPGAGGYRAGVRRLAPLLVLVATLGACDRGGRSGSGGAVSYSENGLAMTASFDEPLRTGRPVTWRLEVENRGHEAVTLRFSSSKEGDVALRQGDREVYRWSAGRLFSQALRELPLGPGAKHTFSLEDRGLTVPAGAYELAGELASDPTLLPVRRPVRIER